MLLNKKEFENLKDAFEKICNLYYATEKDNFSTCSVFHIQPFNPHWDKKTVKEIIYSMRLYIGSWVIPPMEQALKMSRKEVKKNEKSRHKAAVKRKKKRWQKIFI